MKVNITSVTLLSALLSGAATAGNVTIPNTFTSNTKAVASEVNDNFTAVKTAVDDNQTQIDDKQTQIDALSTRVDGSAEAVLGNNPGDMQYWDGSQWVVLDAPTAANATLGFCGGAPSWSCFKVGDTGPGGGIVFLVNPDGVSGLEAATADIPGNPTWGCEGFVTGTVTDIGSGAANTSTLVSTCGVGTAARAADDFIFGGKEDWYLPSKDELNTLYLQKDKVGGFGTGSNAFYWSSSEFDANNAWDQNFDTGVQDNTNGKGNTAIRVRAIRSF